MITRIVIIGATGSARKRTAPALSGIEEVKIVAVQGRDENKLIDMCNQYDITKYYTDTIDMLQNEEYDLIYIATPPFMHYHDIKCAVEFNKPIICEKPFCLDSEEAFELFHLINDNNIPFMVAHHLRHQKAYDFIKRYIENGKLGRINFIHARWDYILDINKPSSLWKNDFYKSGGGVMNDVGIHLIDFITSLFGPPMHIYANGHKNGFNVYSEETSMFTYDGCLCVLDCSYTRENIDNDFLICGSKACMRIPKAMGEESITQIHIDDKVSRKTIYFKDENLYANEVIDFISYLSGDETVTNRVTTPLEALDSMEIIDVMRSMFENV